MAGTTLQKKRSVSSCCAFTLPNSLSSWRNFQVWENKDRGSKCLGSVGMRCADVQRNIKRYTLYIFSCDLVMRTLTQPRPKRILKTVVADALSRSPSCWSLIQQHHSKEPIQWTNGTTVALGIHLGSPGWWHLAKCCLHQRQQDSTSCFNCSYVQYVSIGCSDLFFLLPGDIRRLEVSIIATCARC